MITLGFICSIKLSLLSQPTLIIPCSEFLLTVYMACNFSTLILNCFLNTEVIYACYERIGTKNATLELTGWRRPVCRRGKAFPRMAPLTDHEQTGQRATKDHTLDDSAAFLSSPVTTILGRTLSLLTKNSQKSTCLCFPCARIEEICHQSLAWACFLIYKNVELTTQDRNYKMIETIGK